MCSRFELNASPRDLVRRFDLKADPPNPPAGDIRPTDLALVIAADRLPRRQRFGLPAPWGWRGYPPQKPPGGGKLLINARAETLAQKATFRPLLARRCLVPATAYFEWRKEGRAKQRNRIAPRLGGIMAFAGVSDGDCFVIITCAPAAAIAHIHGRMPVVLDGAAETLWLDAALPFAEIARLLVPCAGETLQAAEEAGPPPKQGDLFG